MCGLSVRRLLFVIMSNHHTLKIWATVRDGHLFVFREFSVVCRIAAPSIIFASFMVSCGGVLIFGDISYAPPPPYLELIVTIVALFMAGHVSVGIQRAILLKENELKIFRFGRTEIRYIAILVGLVATFYVPRILGVDSAGIYALLMMIAVTFNIWVHAFLPAVAISDAGVSPHSVWQNLSKNRIRFAAIILINCAIFSAYLSIVAGVAVFMTRQLISIVPLFHLPASIEMLFFSVPLLAILICGHVFISVMFAGVFSEIYKFIAESTLALDDKYTPPNGLRNQLL